MNYDYHVHSNYSDGSILPLMVRAAAEAGLDGVGFADHCNLLSTPEARAGKLLYGHNLDGTYERRREAISILREEADIAVFDAVEMDYEPADEVTIERFLDEADFDYAVGSVHGLDGTNVHDETHFAGKSERARRALVDEYFEKLVALVDSELFAVAAHVDIVERNPALRGLATTEHYEAVADALSGSRTVPEINAGRVLADYGEFHPAPDFLDVLARAGIPVTVGTDSHAPGDISPRVERIDALLAERDIEPVKITTN